MQTISNHSEPVRVVWRVALGPDTELGLELRKSRERQDLFLSAANAPDLADAMLVLASVLTSGSEQLNRLCKEMAE